MTKLMLETKTRNKIECPRCGEQNHYEGARYCHRCSEPVHVKSESSVIAGSQGDPDGKDL